MVVGAQNIERIISMRDFLSMILLPSRNDRQKWHRRKMELTVVILTYEGMIF